MSHTWLNTWCLSRFIFELRLFLSFFWITPRQQLDHRSLPSEDVVYRQDCILDYSKDDYIENYWRSYWDFQMGRTQHHDSFENWIEYIDQPSGHKWNEFHGPVRSQGQSTQRLVDETGDRSSSEKDNNMLHFLLECIHDLLDTLLLLMDHTELVYHQP